MLKITPALALEGDAEHGYHISIRIGKGPGGRTIQINTAFRGDPQTPTPVRLLPDLADSFDFWLCRGKVFRVEDAESVPIEEVHLRIKHAALQQEKEVQRIQREVQAFENLDRTTVARRERIPDDVRLFVWQRDEGKCVRCGSQDRLEFDHIIPVAEGGSNTARNIQLLCQTCNRQKGKSI